MTDRSLAALCALLRAEVDLLGSGRDADLRLLELSRALEVDRTAPGLGLPSGARLDDLVRCAPPPWSQRMAALGEELRAACLRCDDGPPTSLRDFLAERVDA